MLPASLVVLPGLTTYLRSFVLYTGFLSNPAFNTKFLFLPLNGLAHADLAKNKNKQTNKKDFLCEQVLFVRFYNNPVPVIRSMQFHYCTVSNPGTGADDAFVLKRGVERNATWHSHSRRCGPLSNLFSPLIFGPLVCLPTLCSPSPFYALSNV